MSGVRFKESDYNKINYRWPKKGEVISWTSTQGGKRVSLVVDDYPDLKTPDNEPLRFQSSLPSASYYLYSTTTPSEALYVMTGHELHYLWSRPSDLEIIGHYAAPPVDG
jgi:hypothetical protein